MYRPLAARRPRQPVSIPLEHPARTTLQQSVEVRSAYQTVNPEKTGSSQTFTRQDLEHLPDPVGLLRDVAALLAPQGFLVIRVPNDFNVLQLSAQKTLGKAPWWVAVPDHVNYFTYRSLRGLLQRLGWEVVYAQGDFPMEMFLLMGDDYVAHPEVGARCHRKRQQLELALSGEDRRAWYRALAEAGLGRNCLMMAKRGTP